MTHETEGSGGKAAAPVESLIAQLEKLTGPNFAIECEIAKAVGWLTGMISDPITGPEHVWSHGDKIHMKPPAYTASVDAALQLVPGTPDWDLTWIATDGPPRAEVKLYTVPYMLARTSDHEHYGQAATTSIAICVAALKARAKAPTTAPAVDEPPFVLGFELPAATVDEPQGGEARTLKLLHASDCSVHNEPAYPAGPCDCGAEVAQAELDKITKPTTAAPGAEPDAEIAEIEKRQIVRKTALGMGHSTVIWVGDVVDDCERLLAKLRRRDGAAR